MQLRIPDQRGDLVFRHDFFADPTATSAHAALIRAIFDMPPDRTAARRDPAWVRFAYFDATGSCVAGVEAAVLATLEDATERSVTAIRLAGVAPSCRGLGLFRDLMTHALAWCDEQSPGPTLLYTEDHALYTRFGFQPLAQHAFIGSAPSASRSRAAEMVEGARAEQLLDRLLPVRAPVSRAWAILRAPDLLRANLCGDGDLSLAYAPDLDALVAYEVNNETLILVDVVAATIPSLARIVGTLETTYARVRTLFPPDQLDWSAAPEPDETGLMIRGPMPPAMRRPFMLPPSMSF